jgi:hypothetical protein
MIDEPDFTILPSFMLDDAKNWRCPICGETVIPADSRWRWNGRDWQHHHGHPIGHVTADYIENMFKKYIKTKPQEMRQYIPGEDLSAISVNKEDTPKNGGMIARNENNHNDQWYVDEKFFIENYEEYKK